MKVFSSQYTKLEIELVKSKQQLGDALNQIQELETTSDFTMGLQRIQKGKKQGVRESHQLSAERKSEESKSRSVHSDESPNKHEQNLSYDDSQINKNLKPAASTVEIPKAR